jgi:hypothetical protein
MYRGLIVFLLLAGVALALYAMAVSLKVMPR